MQVIPEPRVTQLAPLVPNDRTPPGPLSREPAPRLIATFPPARRTVLGNWTCHLSRGNALDPPITLSSGGVRTDYSQLVQRRAARGRCRAPAVASNPEHQLARCPCLMFTPIATWIEDAYRRRRRRARLGRLTPVECEAIIKKQPVSSSRHPAAELCLSDSGRKHRLTHSSLLHPRARPRSRLGPSWPRGRAGCIPRGRV